MATTASRLELVQSKTLAALVQEEVAGMIRDGQLAAGARLVESWFTSRLNVNRAAVREAFRALEEAGLVRLEKNRGAFVREFSKEEAVELYEMRSCFEEMIGRRLAGTITDTQHDELSRFNARLGVLGSRSAINQYYPLNIRFHARLAELARHTVLLDNYRRLTDQMHLIRRCGYELGGGLVQSHAEHVVILDALIRRDPDEAARAMRTHNENGLRRYLAV